MKRFEITDFGKHYRKVVECEGIYDVLYDLFKKFHWSVISAKGKATAVNPDNDMDMYFIEEVK